MGAVPNSLSRISLPVDPQSSLGRTSSSGMLEGLQFVFRVSNGHGMALDMAIILKRSSTFQGDILKPFNRGIRGSSWFSRGQIVMV